MYTFTSKVRYSELAPDRGLSLVGLIDYFQDTCNFESESIGVGMDYLKEKKAVWMLTQWQIKIIRRPAMNEEIHSITWASGFRRFLGQRCFELKGADDELLAYAYSEWAYISTETGRPAIPSEEEVKAYGDKGPFDREIEKGKLKVPEELTECPSFTVSRCHLDTNNHVNNGQYVALAMDFLPEGYIPYGLKASYKGQSMLHDVIIPKVKKTENGFFVGLWGEEGDLRFAGEFQTKEEALGK